MKLIVKKYVTRYGPQTPYFQAFPGFGLQKNFSKVSQNGIFLQFSQKS